MSNKPVNESSELDKNLARFADALLEADTMEAMDSLPFTEDEDLRALQDTAAFLKSAFDPHQPDEQTAIRLRHGCCVIRRVAEVGRQPWAIQNLLPVKVATTNIATSNVQTTFFIFLTLFTILLIAEIRIILNQIKIGPEE